MPVPAHERLDVQLVAALFDRSGSQAGEGSEAMNAFSIDLGREVLDDVLYAECLRFGMVAFADDASTLIEIGDLTEIDEMPQLEAGGGTNFAAGFREAKAALERFYAAHPDKAPTRRALLVMLTDGMHNAKEDWKPAFAALTDPAWADRPFTMVFGCGQADPDELKKIPADRVYIARDTDSIVQIKEILGTLRRTIRTATLAAATGKAQNAFTPEVPENHFIALHDETER